jgi:DNA-binding transcriptional LysR family regulator
MKSHLSTINFNDLYLFSQIVEHQGFTNTSIKTGIPKSSISRRIAQLEKTLGVRLIQRTSRQFQITELGKIFYEHCATMVIAAQRGEEAIRNQVSEMRGNIRISCPILFGQKILAPLFPKFMEQHPKVNLIIDFSNEKIEMIREQLDLSIRIHHEPLDDSGLIQKQLCQIDRVVLASPKYLLNQKKILNIEDLDTHQGLTFDSSFHSSSYELHHKTSGIVKKVTPIPKLLANDLYVILEACLMGLGIAILPRYMCQNHINKGELQQILPEWCAPNGYVSLLLPSRKGISPPVRALINFLTTSIDHKKI